MNFEAKPRSGRGKGMAGTPIKTGKVWWHKLFVQSHHSLTNGNKRLALTTSAVFLSLNGYVFFVPQNEAVNFATRVADVNSPDVSEISRWFRRRSISLVKFLKMDMEEQTKWLDLIEAASGYRKRLIAIIHEFTEIQ